MDMMQEFLATGFIVEVDSYIGFVGSVEYWRKCNNCGLAPTKVLQVTRGMHQYHFCRICAFTARDAVELFYSWRSRWGKK